MATERELDHERIRAACAQVPLIDAHAHNVVALDSSMPFLQCFSEARGHEALSSVPHSLSFQVACLTYLLTVSADHGAVPDVLFIPRSATYPIILNSVSAKCAVCNFLHNWNSQNQHCNSSEHFPATPPSSSSSPCLALPFMCPRSHEVGRCRSSGHRR